MRLRKLFALLFAASLLFAACSDDSGDDESSDDTSEEESSGSGSGSGSSGDEEATDEGGDEGGDESGGGDGDFSCDEVNDAFEELGTASASDPQSVADAFQEVADNGPPELADDAQVIADAMADYDPDDPLASAEVFTDPEFSEALTNFGTNLASACLEDVEEQLDEELGDITIPSIPDN